MATTKTISAKRTSTTKVVSAAEMKRFDDNLAKTNSLFEWVSDAQKDLESALLAEIAGDTAMATTCVIAALKQSEMFEMMVREYHQSGEGSFQLVVLCARSYLAGKMSGTRYAPEALIS